MVTRCVCRDIPFEDLLAIARESEIDFDTLCDRTGCCTGCSMCEPYVRLTLATGRTAHPVLNGPAVRAALRIQV
jgi:bacterioferritin-associated ferredoxin